MEDWRKEFIFEEHITKIDYSQYIRNLEKKLKSPFTFRKQALKKKIESYKNDQKIVDNQYYYFNKLFREIKNQNRCKAGYVIFPDGNLQVFIEGQGIEKIAINGRPEFEKDEDEKTTTISVTIGNNDDCKLIIPSQPQVDLPIVGSLSVYYKFKTEFYAFQEDDETKNMLKERSDYSKRYFYKKDGKVCFRASDALYESLEKGIMPIWRDNKNSNFEMYGQMHIQDTLFYQGNFGCTSYWFPFCINPDDNDNRNREKSPTPKQPEAVKA